MLLERKYDGHQRAAQLAGRVGNSKQPTCAPSGYESKSGNPYWKGVPTPITARHRTVQLLNAGHSFAQIGRERGACNRNLASKISADLAAAGVGADPWQVIVPGAHARPKYATRKIQPDVAVFLRLVFSCNPQVTNKTLRLYAGLYMGVIVSTDAIATMLTENRIFRKRVAKMHRFVFRECNLQWARQFRLFRQGILADDCVFIDEWGANRFIMSNYGRAPGSQRAVGQQNELLNAHRTTFLTAMTSTEVLADATLAVEYPDTVKGLTIEEWLFQIIIPLMLVKGKRYLVLDNAGIHRKNIINFMLSHFGLGAIWIPPYSPWLMPIEKVFLATRMRLQGRIVDYASVVATLRSFTPRQMRGYCRATGWF